MFNCFIKYYDGVRRKIIKLNNNDIWMISIPDDKWSKTISKYVSYWISQMNKGCVNYKIKHASIENVGIQIEDIDRYCCSCKKILGSRQYLVKHAKKCNPQAIVENTRIPAENTVQMREYGKENPRWFTKGLMYSVMGDITNAIPKLVEHKHFNDRFPENKNLQIENRKTINKRLRIFERGRWKTRDSKQTFYKVMIDIYDILCDALEKDEEIEGDVIEGVVPEEDHVVNEIRKLHSMETFTKKLQKIQPIWNRFRSHIDNQETRIDMWEDLKTFLLDRQLAIEQGFD